MHTTAQFAGGDTAVFMQEYRALHMSIMDKDRRQIGLMQFACPYDRLTAPHCVELLLALRVAPGFPEWTKHCLGREDLMCKICHANHQRVARTLHQHMGDYAGLLRQS